MSHHKNLVGLTFNELTVLEPVDYKLQGMKTYRCRCSCGKICEVRGNHLTTGNTKSCGHLKKIALQKSKKRIDFKNQQAGDFLVEEYSYNDPTTHSAVWSCRCIRCNKKILLKSYHLRSNYKTKCNCNKVTPKSTLSSNKLPDE